MLDGGTAGSVQRHGEARSIAAPAGPASAQGSDAVMRSIARQMADALPQAQLDRAVHLKLDPVELGQVRMTLTTRHDGVSLTVVAERHDTLDMMRRHIDGLAQEFRDIGYRDLSFSFAQGGGGNGSSAGAYGPAPEETGGLASMPDGAPAIALLQAPGSGLDLRL